MKDTEPFVELRFHRSHKPIRALSAITGVTHTSCSEWCLHSYERKKNGQMEKAGGNAFPSVEAGESIRVFAFKNSFNWEKMK